MFYPWENWVSQSMGAQARSCMFILFVSAVRGSQARGGRSFDISLSTCITGHHRLYLYMVMAKNQERPTKTCTPYFLSLSLSLCFDLPLFPLFFDVSVVWFCGNSTEAVINQATYSYSYLPLLPGYSTPLGLVLRLSQNHTSTTHALSNRKETLISWPSYNDQEPHIQAH